MSHDVQKDPAGPALLPASIEIRQRTEAARQAQRAARQHQVDEAARLAWLDTLRGRRLSEAEIRHRLVHLAEAADQGDSQFLWDRFPSDLCTDRGRAINNFEEGWFDTLTGIPRQLYGYWESRLQQLGYGITAAILDFPDGIPGDAGLFLTW